MMRGKYSLAKRTIAFVLSLVLLLSVVPATGVLAASPVTEGIVQLDTDPYTLNAWKDTAFDPYKLTTEHAGGVWTDKSVLSQTDIAAALPGVSGLSVGGNNFLVALSALAANSVVTGRGTTPTDTVFVLDISGSMSSSELSAMVSATNDAIHTLLTGNPDSRIGVVLYSTRAYDLLPLGRYTPVTDDQDTETTADDVIEYIELTNNSIRTARIQTWVENEDEDDDDRPGRPGGGRNDGYWQTDAMLTIEGTTTQVNTSVNLRGGTYIQGGLWRAWEQFSAAADTENRTPVLVLMSDGAPTYLTNDYNNVPASYESGDGNSSGDGDAFLSQLTAAYVKEKMAAKYGTAAYMYTLGLGVSDSNYGTTVAEAMLDTSKSRTDLEAYWNTFLALATAENKTMSVELAGENWDVTVTYDDIITAESRGFVDKYFPASDASQLSAAFQGIVNEISLKGGYYVTRLDGAGTHASGYVTFVDEIGTGMEVKDIKGILIGDQLFTGVNLAKALIEGAFGTATEPTALGDNMVWALKQRLGITETAVVHDLIQQAYDAGQIAYNTETGEFSNYIGWYSDADGDYLGFWDYADADYPIPADAAYANMSYGMLGTTTDSQTAHASDMMYVAVMVSKQITEVSGKPALEAKTPELVTFRVPASLLPTVTYQIDVDAEADEEITADTEATITYIPADPIRLLYEVGVHSQLTPENIHQFVREGYQAKDEKGNYYLYTNAWYWEPSDGSAANFNNPPKKDNDIGKDVLYNPSKNHITYAHFEPGEDNEHYYYTEDTVLYVKDGENYVPATGTLDTTGNTQYYYPHRTFVSKAAASATNTAVEAMVEYHYEQIDIRVLSDANDYAQNASGQWYIKEGTMRYSIHSHDRNKTENTTGSFFARMHNLINIGLDGQEAYHSELVYLGNNGRITYPPAQGFTLAKAMAEGAEATGSFTFEITVTGDTDGKVKLDGVEQNLTNNKLTVSLLAGQSVTVTGIDVGATYSVTEQGRQGYKLGGIVSDSTTATVTVATATVSDTVQTNKVHEITFTNDIQLYGSLLVSKDVTYNKGVDPQSNTTIFQMEVTLTAMAGKQVYVNGTATDVNEQGKLYLKLKDGEQALITGIPEGTAYTVTEKTDLLTKGYTVTAGSFSGNIKANETAVAAVQNAYTPDDVVISGTDPAITLQVTKRLEVDFDTSDDRNSSYAFDKHYNFKFLLQRYNATTGDWDTLSDDSETTIHNPAEPNSDYYGEGNIGTVQISMENITFDTVGNHYFRIKEYIPDDLEAGWTYDRTHHDFVVVVTDTNLDGKLEITSVEKVDQTVTVTPTDTNSDNVTDVWAVGAGFLNNYAAQSTKLTIAAKKTFTNTITGENLLKDGQFGFALYEVDDDTYDITGITDPKTAKNGAGGDIIFTTETYPFNSTDKYYYYVLKETSTGGNGITVDDTVYEIRVKVSSVGSNAVVSEVAWREKGKTDYNQLAAIPANNVFNSITFNNTYTPAPVEQAVIKATKTLTDLTPGAADTKLDVKEETFSFTLSAVDGAPMPEKATVYAAAGGAVSFGVIKYTEADTYRYKLTENDTGVSGVTYDKSEYTVTVVVTDNGTGNLVVSSVTYTKGGVNGTAATFANTYLAKPVTNFVLEGNKVLRVDTTKYTRILKAGEFHFTLTKPDGTTETVSNDASGEFKFSALSFDTVGSYDYTITEYGAGQTHNGVQYDATTKTVTINVVDNGEGQLVAKVNGPAITTYDFGEFENIYTATSATVKLEGYKDLVGRDLNEGEFSFTLTAQNGAPMPEGSTDGKMTVENAQDGTIAFGTITYDAVGEYVYTVVENKPVEENEDGEYVHNGVTYSQLTYTVTVTVTDNGLGALTAEVSSVDNHGVKDPVEFANRYKAASVTVNLEGDSANTDGKTLIDESSTVDKTLADFEFKFQLMDAQKNVLQTVTENNAGFDFEDIEFTTAGTYTYYIAEVKGTDAGVTYDETLYRVTVTIEDNLKGQMVVKELKYEKAENADSNTFEDAEDVVFANTYKAKETSVSFAGKKTMEGGRKLKGDDFNFVLTAKNGAPMAEGNTTGTETVKNDADGFFAFSAIEFTAEGKYVYTLVEQEGDNERIDYDGTEYTLTVTVKDVDGELKATTKIEKGEDEVDSYGFTNIYTPADAETSITVQKVLKNESDKTMGLDGYTVQLELDGKKTTLTTGTDGKVKFDLTFTAKDVDKTFNYKLTEVKGNVEHMTYDETVYEIKIAVTQNDDGGLVLTTTRKGTGDFTFTNTYAPPAPPTENPKTGDDFNIHGWTLMMAVSAVCGLAVLVLGKKKLLAD